jgi:hypothetical protein
VIPQETKHDAHAWILALPVVLSAALMFCVLAMDSCHGVAAADQVIGQEGPANSMRRGTPPIEVRLPDEPGTPPSGPLTFLASAVKDGAGNVALRTTLPLHVRPPAGAPTEIRDSQEGVGGAAATPDTDVVMTPSVAT